MPAHALEKRCQEVLERAAVLRIETQRSREQYEALQRSFGGLKADLDPLFIETRAQVGRSAAVRQTSERVAAQCTVSFDAANSLIRAQNELEADVLRCEIDHTIERLIRFFEGHGVVAFRSDDIPDLPVV